MFKLLRKLFGKTKRQHGRWVMNMEATTSVSGASAFDQYIKDNTPVITAAQYNKLSPECKRLFVKVGK